MSDKRTNDIAGNRDASAVGTELHAILSDLYPICRSITGDGLRESLRRLQQFVPLTLHEVPSGTQVFDWIVPKEWNIRDAYIKNSRGDRLVDFRASNLHVVNYSVPIRQKMRLAELRPHLFTLPEHPDWVPYRTSYYSENWGFCLSHRQLAGLTDDDQYEVCIDSTLANGSLTYGEFRIQGDRDEEVLISAHSCHPSLANDNLSGMVVAAKLAEVIRPSSLRYSYRFLWIPGTIGAISWLALNESVLPRIRHGLVLSCLGDPGRFSYKRSRRGDAEVDKAVACVLRDTGFQHDVFHFTPYGYDERQYCSPGINLPVGCFMRTPNGKYPEYHTSADNLDLVKSAGLADSLHRLIDVVDVLESNRRYVNLKPMGEPQLGRRGLYGQIGGASRERQEEAILWVLNQSDGTRSLLEIADRSHLNFKSIAQAARALLSHGLLRRAD